MIGKCSLNIIYWFIEHWFIVINWLNDSVWIISKTLCYSRSLSRINFIVHIRAHISVNLIVQSFDHVGCSSLEAILKLNVQFSMWSSVWALMWCIFCEKLIITQTLSLSLNVASIFSRLCTHLLVSLGELSSDNCRIVIEWNGMAYVSIVLDFVDDQIIWCVVHDHLDWNLWCFTQRCFCIFHVWAVSSMYS